MDGMDVDTFQAYFDEQRTWTTVLSDGTQMTLKDTDEPVNYDERLEYSQMVKEVRIVEMDSQVLYISCKERNTNFSDHDMNS